MQDNKSPVRSLPCRKSHFTTEFFHNLLSGSDYFTLICFVLFLLRLRGNEHTFSLSLQLMTNQISPNKQKEN